MLGVARINPAERCDRIRDKPRAATSEHIKIIYSLATNYGAPWLNRIRIGTDTCVSSLVLFTGT
jgi:hypothetical protein